MLLFLTLMLVRQHLLRNSFFMEEQLIRLVLLKERLQLNMPYLTGWKLRNSVVFL